MARKSQRVHHHEIDGVLWYGRPPHVRMIELKMRLDAESIKIDPICWSLVISGDRPNLAEGCFPWHW